MIDTRTAPYAALLLRVSLGVLFLAHGLLLKVLTFTIPGTVGYFQSIGYPGTFAYLVIAGEIGAGVASHSRGIHARDCAPGAAHSDRRDAPAYRQWLGVFGHRRRLGIPGVLDRDAARADTARRRCLCLAAFVRSGLAEARRARIIRFEGGRHEPNRNNSSSNRPTDTPASDRSRASASATFI